MDESLTAREAAYERYLEASDNRRASMRAFDIAYAYFLRGNETVGSGWVNRAQRLVEHEPDCAEQGYLLYFSVETSLDGGEETMAKVPEWWTQCARPDGEHPERMADFVGVFDGN